MSQQNVETVRALLDPSTLGDAQAFMAALDPAIEWTPVTEDPDFRVHRGLEDVGAWLAEWAEVFPDMRWEAERILDAGGDDVVALVRARGRGDSTGADVGSQVYPVVFAVRSGKIVRIDESGPEAALKAVGLEE
jgi:ketosteroid isomerase-like protein